MKTIITIASIAIITLTSATLSNVYITASGKKYHTHQDCQYLKRSKTIKAVSLAEAQKASLTICSACENKDKK